MNDIEINALAAHFVTLLAAEVKRVDAKLGADQDAPCGDGSRASNLDACRSAQYICEIATAAQAWSWLDVLREEFWEVAAEVDATKLQKELVQVAAVCLRWWRAIERRRK